MSKLPRYFSSEDTTYRTQSSAPQGICADQLEMRYRELQELREQVREVEQQSEVGPEDRKRQMIGH